MHAAIQLLSAAALHNFQFNQSASRTPHHGSTPCDASHHTPSAVASTGVAKPAATLTARGSAIHPCITSLQPGRHTACVQDGRPHPPLIRMLPRALGCPAAHRACMHACTRCPGAAWSAGVYERLSHSRQVPGMRAVAPPMCTTLVPRACMHARRGSCSPVVHHALCAGVQGKRDGHGCGPRAQQARNGGRRGLGLGARCA